ncbi:MAG: hypothetical protein KA072_07945 [Thermoanaerobaculaceae bacterium]|nr:hypothetical protein [Thermoanaerobaculaceae bacterium]
MTKLQVLTSHAVGFCHRLAYGLLASLITFIALGVGVQPDRFELVLFYLAKVLNLPVALVGLLTFPYGGIDLWFGRGYGPDPRQLLKQHLTFSLPIYLALFYVPAVIRALYRRWRGPSRHAEEEEYPRGRES